MHDFLSIVGSVCSIIGVMPQIKKLFQKRKHKKENSEPTVPAEGSLIVVVIEIPASITVIIIF